jgi:5-methylcytosine-specific restriction endonuclease McrA
MSSSSDKLRPWKKAVTAPIPAENPNASRGKDTQIYRRAPWRTLRARILADEPYCRLCAQQERITDATMVDHIIPIEKGGAPLDPANCQPLCNRCHAIKSAKDKKSMPLPE